MKKPVVLILILVVIAVGAYFVLSKRNANENPEQPKQQALLVSKNDETFNKAFAASLEKYYVLKDAFVEWDSTKAGKAAGDLAASVSQIPFGSLKSDTTIISTAKNFADGIVSESKAIQGTPEITEQRHSFYTLSEDFYNLVRTVRYDQAVIYHVNCPMAFNDEQEAFWISNTNDVVNPYLGKKHPKYKSGMINCGEVKDSIDFRHK